MENLAAAISFGTSPAVNGLILDRASELAKSRGLALWADHYFHKFGLVPKGSGILGGPLEGNYVANVMIFFSLAKHVQLEEVQGLVIVHAPQMGPRIELDRRVIPSSVGVELNTCGLKEGWCYGEDSEHPQTRNPKDWWKYEKGLLWKAKLVWPAYALRAGLTLSQLIDVRFGFGLPDVTTHQTL